MRTTTLALLVLGSGCLVPFETPPAYDDQRYLCAPEHADAFARIVDECRATLENDEGEPCAGAWSMTGVLDGYDVTVESKFVTSTFMLSDHEDVDLLEQIDASGPTPYFTLSVQLESIGGSEVVESRDLLLDRRADALPDDLADASASLELRLSGGGDSENIVGQTGSGALTLEEQSLSEVRGSFEGGFGEDGDPLQGCFHLMALETRTVSE